MMLLMRGKLKSQRPCGPCDSIQWYHTLAALTPEPPGPEHHHVMSATHLVKILAKKMRWQQLLDLNPHGKKQKREYLLEISLNLLVSRISAMYTTCQVSMKWNHGLSRHQLSWLKTALIGELTLTLYVQVCKMLLNLSTCISPWDAIH